MTDIKELALKIADQVQFNTAKPFTCDQIEEFALRFLAAYTEGQEPVGEVIGFFDNGMPRIAWFDAYPEKSNQLFTTPQLPAIPEGMVQQAKDALDSMDDFARMANVDAIGPRKVLEDFIKIAAGEVKP